MGAIDGTPLRGRQHMRWRYRALIALPAMLLAAPLCAQIMLPGAVPPGPPSVAPPAGSPPKAGKPRDGNPAGASVAKPAVVKAPGEDAVAGRQFLRNGSTGVLSLEKSGTGLRIDRLSFTGYQISKPTEVCRVEIGGGPIELRTAPRHQGLFSFDAPVEACPFSLDVLEGAALLRAKTCDFVAADCRIDPSGVWGPPPDSIGPAEDKTIEKQRAAAEAEARASFRALLADNKGNRAKIKEIASEQASFSSIREEICRDYAGEDKHGFCASRVTMARAVALSAELHGAPEDGSPAKPPKKKRPPKPKPTAPPPPAAAPMQ